MGSRSPVGGFYNEQSDELAKLPEMLADAHIARIRLKRLDGRAMSKYGRDPTDQQRSWLVNIVEDTNGHSHNWD